MGVRAGEGPTAAHSGGGALFASFLPWIVYWIMVGNVDFRLAVLVAFAISAFRLVEGLRAGELPKVLDIGSTAAFAVLTVVSYATNDHFLERWIQPLTSGCLLVIALASVVIGRPFARQYAREQVPPEVLRSSTFLRTTTVITWAWVGVFAAMTVSSLIPPIVDGDATFTDQDDTLGVIFYWVIPFVALALGVLFTKWYPERVRRQARAQVVAA